MSQPKSNEGHIAYSPEINAVRAVLVKYLNEYPADLLADLAQLLAQKDKEVLDLILNAGKNSISMLDPDRPRCEHCLNGFTGTYWISQNNLIHQLTGKHLSEFTTAEVTEDDN